VIDERSDGTSFPIINRIISQSPFLRSKLANLEGTKVIVEVLDLPAAFGILVLNGEIFNLSDLSSFDVKISGSSFNFIKMLLLLKQGEPTPAGLLEVSGDVSVIRKYQKITESLGADYEIVLSELLGGLSTKFVVKVLNKSVSLKHHFLNDFSDDLRDFLVHESRLLLSSQDCSDFSKALDDVVERVDILSYKISKLDNHLHE